VRQNSLASKRHSAETINDTLSSAMTDSTTSDESGELASMITDKLDALASAQVLSLLPLSDMLLFDSELTTVMKLAKRRAQTAIVHVVKTASNQLSNNGFTRL
jgi:hypothetical protein